MSVFRHVAIACPACGAVARLDLVLSVNADRRPDLRQAILDGSFQRETCAACGTVHRTDPAFTYVDLKRHQYIGVWPSADRAEWQARAAATQEAFDAAYGARATGLARDLGKGVQLRVVFGWPALVEKILAAEAGVDDRTLELLKVSTLRHSDRVPLPGELELRLVGLEPGAEGPDLVLAWVDPRDGIARDPILVERARAAAVEAEPAPWMPLLESLGTGPVVDFQREMLPA